MIYREDQLRRQYCKEAKVQDIYSLIEIVLSSDKISDV